MNDTNAPPQEVKLGDYTLNLTYGVSSGRGGRGGGFGGIETTDTTRAKPADNTYIKV